ncbi:ABC 3 transport family protein [compost metagenome]
MLIAPGAIAFLITRTMGSMLIVAVLVATVASFSGVYLSFFIDSAPAPTIVLLMTVIFLAAFLWSSFRAARIEAQRTTIE